MKNYKDLENKNSWTEYYKITKNKPPSKILVQALDYVKNKGKAIDIGGGALKNTKFLLHQGFEVTVIDKEELMAKEAEKIKSKKLHYFVTSFDKFNFPQNTYDIACATFALPFNPPNTFNTVFRKIKESLVEEGIFCGQLFGIRDEWSNNSKMTFHTKKEFEKLFKNMKLLYFKEEEVDGSTVNKVPKHWHIFHFIAQK